MNIAVVGTGYVGLVSGVCLAKAGHNVICVDINPTVVSSLNNGVCHIFERGLDNLLEEVLKANRFKATTSLEQALDVSDVVILAVGTPSNYVGEIDLTQIKEASKQIGNYLKTVNRFISIVVKSTVIPTTTDTVVKSILEKQSGKIVGQFGLGMNPEFLREGEAVEDFMKADRIVIGYEDPVTRQLLEEVYKSWECAKLYTNTRTAEMIKYANNTLLATIISINNELANLATSVGNIDYLDVIKGVIKDKRWTTNGISPGIVSYFTPGAGFGGSCFPKDVQAIKSQGQKAGLSMEVTNAVLSINDNQASQVFNLLHKKHTTLTDKRILHLGLAFKPGTDDLRESSSVRILRSLLSANAKIFAHDPLLKPSSKESLKHDNLQIVDNWELLVKDVDIIVIGTNWEEYLNLTKYLPLLKQNNITVFDTKRLFTIQEMQDINYLTYGYYGNK